jgi:hypothetical protein
VPDEKAEYWNAHGWATIGPAGSGVNEVQRLTVYGYSTTGTFTLSFNGRETGPISGHSTAGEIEDALTGLIGIGRNDVRWRTSATGCTRTGFQHGHPSFAASFEKLRTLVFETEPDHKPFDCLQALAVDDLGVEAGERSRGLPRLRAGGYFSSPRTRRWSRCASGVVGSGPPRMHRL